MSSFASASEPGCVLAFVDERERAAALAHALGVPLALIERHRFPDGELRLRLPAELPACVVLLRSLQQPNEKLVELLIAAPAARELGARRLLLVCPYLAYMRQDIAFAPGEAVSQRHIGALLASRFDAVLTVDPHLHRIAALSEVMPGCRAVSLSAAPLLGAWIAQHVVRPLLLGPDEESAQWVREAAGACAAEGARQHKPPVARSVTRSVAQPGVRRAAHPAGPSVDFAWCVKQRSGDREVLVTLPPGLDCIGRAVVLIDDMASTGRTLVAAAGLVLAAGAASVDVAVTHALFVGDALAELHAAGVGRVWSTDCVPHASNAIGTVPLLAQALRAL